MTKVTRFIFNQDQHQLSVQFDNQQQIELGFEYLRVASCQPYKANQIPAHKKAVALEHIEFVGKHGYRLCFDDNYQVILSDQQLFALHQEYSQRWQYYLDQVEQFHINREQSIEIKQL